MSHLRDVVHPRCRDTLGIVVAATQPCFRIATEQQMKAVGRTIHIASPEAFHRIKRPKSWAVAVILCPRDDTEVLAAFVKANKLSAQRFHFYYHPTTDFRKALQPWHDAGLAVYSTWPVASWQDLNRHFGAHWNNLAHDDFCTIPGCVMR